MAFYSLNSYEPRISVGYLVKRIFKLSHAEVEARFADLDVSFTQWGAMVMVAKGMAATSGELAWLIGHDSGATTRLIDGLEQRGLLVRTRDTADRRVVRLSLTDTGLETVLRLMPRVMDYWNALLCDFTQEEAGQLVGLLQRLTDRLERGETTSATAGADA